MCFLKERCESHHSPRNFVDSSTGRSVSPIVILRGLVALYRGAVKCTTLHLWAANLKPYLVAHSCMAFTDCCRCLFMVSRERPQKQIARSSTKNALKTNIRASLQSHLTSPHPHTTGTSISSTTGNSKQQIQWYKDKFKYYENLEMIKPDRRNLLRARIWPKFEKVLKWIHQQDYRTILRGAARRDSVNWWRPVLSSRKTLEGGNILKCHIMSVKRITSARIRRRETQRSWCLFERPGDPTCPVVSLEKYRSKLNRRCMSWLFQTPNTKITVDSNNWYENMAVGQNTLDNKMKMKSADVKCSLVYTNQTSILHESLWSMSEQRRLGGCKW